MATKVTIKKKTKYLEKEIFLRLIQDFINDSYSGRRTKKNGTKISSGTVRNYHHMQRSLAEFSEYYSTFELKLPIYTNLTQTERERASRYWSKFYKSFTAYLYDKKGHYDNYVGLIIKCLRSFFNYLNDERNIPVGTYHKSFYVPIEEIPIVALTHEQISYIINDDEFMRRIKERKLTKVHDIFVFGCTVALRVSDLLKLSKNNLQVQGDTYYIQVKSQKTGTFTSIKLPDYAVEILLKYKNRYKTLLPPISAPWFNNQLKQMAKLIPDDFEMIKTREKRGKQVVVYKDKQKRSHYKLSDHISTHTMRRTAITTMLSLGMPEHVVRKISGHAPNSKEFFRYVELAQNVIDKETDRVFDRLVKRRKELESSKMQSFL